MPTIDNLKELEITPTPLFLFDCTLANGEVERWATQAVSFEGHDYRARLLRHNLFELKSSVDEGLDGAAKVIVTLANADSHYSQVERSVGFRGARVLIRFLFFDLAVEAAASEARTVFQGVANAPDEITESSLRLTIANRFNLQRIVLPEVRIQRRCPWQFPSTESQREEALSGGTRGKYSALYRCGYSAGLAGGEGSLNGSVPHTSCDYTRDNCVERGMFGLGRFGGFDFLPAQILVRSHGDSASHVSQILDGQARYNDSVPLVYGTAWYEPPVVFARNDGNLTHLEVLLGMGEVDGVVSVVVNDVELPAAVSGADMTATGWYQIVTPGARSGAQNPDFADASGAPLGDPYGSMAMASVAVPNRISSGQSLPKIKVLLRGLKLEQFDTEGASLGETFTRNPVWVLLDVLRRSGWNLAEIDLPSFASAATYCDDSLTTKDLYGNDVSIKRYQCNFVVRGRRSAAELVRGIRTGSMLLLGYGPSGKLRVRVENGIAQQQPVKPSGSNSTEALNGGWPAYEFSDGSASYSGILRTASGEPAIRLYSRAGSDSPNRLSVEFQDELNEYQQDSLSLVDIDDVLLTGREVNGSHPAVGLPNFDQATRVLRIHLARTIRGSTFVEFETSVRGVGLAPGDLITITYLKEGLNRQMFRILRISPGVNFQSVVIAGQWHDDEWYLEGATSAAGGRRRGGAGLGIPRPLVGSIVDENGVTQFGVSDTVTALAGGEVSVQLRADFQTPVGPTPASVNVPLVNLTPSIAGTGGTLAGDQVLYYAVSAKDSDGSESSLSFAVRARVPAGSSTNAVTLVDLSFSDGTVGFNVYRGSAPARLELIAQNQSPATAFTDTGLPSLLSGPPDENYDHANFYWRMELIPETSVDLHSSTTVGNGALGLGTNDFEGSVVRITRGTGMAQERTVISNTATTLTVSPAWNTEPDSTSFFTVAESTWKFAGLVKASPAEFEGPRIPGATIQVSGRAANVLNRESAYELSPVTRWQIGSAGGVDIDAPPAPVFGLGALGDGVLELAGVGFTSLANTYGISAGVLDLYWWNELNSPSPTSLAAAINASATTVPVAGARPAMGTPLIQIGGEVMEVLDVLAGGTEYHVIRAEQGSVAAAHSAGDKVYHLDRTTVVIPFVKGFFGSPASGSFRHWINLPDARIGAANLYMINGFGNGALGFAAYGGTLDQGIRTLTGGQISVQVEGYLAVQENAAAAFVIERTHAVRDIFAVVREAPDGGDIELTLRQDDEVYCTLTIAEGETVSNVVSGFGLTPLVADSRLYLDITSIPGAANTLPGRDLTVTLRM